MTAPRVILALAIIAAGGGLIAAAQLQPQEKIKPPTTRVKDCTTAGCHSKQVSAPFLHGPNAVQACDACHEHKDPALHSFQLRREGRDLCDFCHIDKTGTEGPVVHKPITEGKCLGCHDPHGSTNRRMLKADTSTQLCVTCHKETMIGAHAHKPATEDCASCHKPHTSLHEKLLTMPRRELCISCHQDVGKTASGSKHPHDPLKGDCMQCHTPHASKTPKILKSAPKDLCLSCHEKTAAAISACARGHDAVNMGDACLNCHVPHGSEHPKQLPKDPVASCMKCHDKPIAVGPDHTVRAVPELADPTLHRHGPIAKGECSGCHDVHGGSRERLLTGNFTTSFYQAYNEQAYELCFKCHDRSLVTQQAALAPTATPAGAAPAQTKFRDGQTNLHALHVNSSTQGRSCRACHTIHASKNPAQINESVQFGQWKLPLNFKQNVSGGSCAPGCHRPESYNRDTPVKPLKLPK